jgi:hypothetical protein
MCDALSRNFPKEFEVILANCLTHGRRYFVEAAANFPEECRYILELLGKVYHNDAIAREQAMTANQRLEFHKNESAPLMDEMKRWLKKQIDEKLCEPNSDLGTGITYMLNHWDLCRDRHNSHNAESRIMPSCCQESADLLMFPEAQLGII